MLQIATLATNLDRLASLGLPIQITEFDMVTPDEQLQADWTRDYLTLVFSHPATVAFLMWGFWDGARWLGDAPLFYSDWTLKPSGRVWSDWVLNHWWTRAEGRTSAAGDYQNRAFLGDYEITIDSGGARRQVKANLDKEGKTVTVTW